MAFWLNIPFFGNFREHVAKLLFELFKHLILAILIFEYGILAKYIYSHRKKKGYFKTVFSILWIYESKNLKHPAISFGYHT
jgi:hypothetical protein